MSGIAIRLQTQSLLPYRLILCFAQFSGSTAYDSVRPLSYQDADVFLLCYNISDPISLYNIKNKWIRELRGHEVDDLPIILCGCQADLRTDAQQVARLGKTGRTPVTTEQALAICCEIAAANYVETSAKCPPDEALSAGGSSSVAASSLTEAFELCALAAIKNRSRKQQNTKNKNSSSSSNKQLKEDGVMLSQMMWSILLEILTPWVR